MKVIAVYCIRNIVNGKHYVGQSQDAKTRLRSHKKDLRHGRHYASHLQNAWDLYGERAFRFEILQLVPSVDMLNKLEGDWINRLNANDPEFGYNTRINPTTNRGLSYLQGEDSGRAILTESDVVEIRRRILSGEGQTALGEEYGVSGKTISAIRLGQSWRHIPDLLEEVISMPTTTGTRDNRGTNNPRAKLSIADVRKIKGLLKEGLTLQRIGDKFDVPKQTIWKIKHGKHWACQHA